MKVGGSRGVAALMALCLLSLASLASASHPKLILQNAYSSLPLCKTGVRNDAWVIGGFGISAPFDIQIPQFLAKTAEGIRETLFVYLDRFPDLSTDTSDIVMLDIEHPVHPRLLGTLLDPGDPGYDPDLFVNLVEAIKLRIAVAREVFPHARLALFGTINPDARGLDERPQFVVSFRGYLEAGRLGLYDQLDYLVPVLYQRFGPTDPAFVTIGEYTRQGIRKSRELTRTDGSPLPLFPLLTFRVFNGNSNHNLQPADMGRLAEQIEILRAEGVSVFGFWNGSDELDPGSPTILEYFQALFDARDVEGDGDVDRRDLLALVKCFRGPSAHCSTDDFLYADLDCDGDVDSADLRLFLGLPRTHPPSSQDRRPIAVLQLYNGTYTPDDPWGLNDCWRAGNDPTQPTLFRICGREGGVKWLISELGRRYARGYRRFMLSLPAGRPLEDPGGWPSAQWHVLDQDANGVPTGIATESGSVQIDLANHLTPWLEERPDVQILIYQGLRYNPGLSQPWRDRDMSNSIPPDLRTRFGRRVLRENTKGWLGLSPHASRRQIGFAFDNTSVHSTRDALVGVVERFSRRRIFVSGEAIPVVRDPNLPPPQGDLNPAYVFRAPWFGLIRFHQASDPNLSWSAPPDTHLGYGVHNVECRTDCVAAGTCPDSVGRVTAECRMSDEEIENAIRSAHERGFVIFHYGGRFDDFVIHVTSNASVPD